MLLQTLANRDGESMWDTESMQMTERLIGVKASCWLLLFRRVGLSCRQFPLIFQVKEPHEKRIEPR